MLQPPNNPPVTHTHAHTFLFYFHIPSQLYLFCDDLKEEAARLGFSFLKRTQFALTCACAPGWQTPSRRRTDRSAARNGGNTCGERETGQQGVSQDFASSFLRNLKKAKLIYFFFKRSRRELLLLSLNKTVSH